MNSFILDYDQVQTILKEMELLGKIIKEKDIGKTKYGLPINHYSLGEGKKHIVITGATHGCEIISTDFVLNLMNEMCKKNNEDILSTYKLHFIPILNPEGYIISTSSIKKLIARNMSLEDAEKICKEYYLAYRADDIEAKQRIKENLEPDRITLKKHQRFFEGIDYNCISDSYIKIKQSVKSIYDKYPDLSKYTLHTWSGNADGIDLQANCEYNSKIQRIESGEIIYKDNLRHSNINISHPGPINCPYDKELQFKLTAETKAISGFLDKLSKENTLDGYYNYHSTGGLIYQRLPIDANKIEDNKELVWNKTVLNYVISKLYAEKTYKNANYKEDTKYKILEDGENISSSNDVFKVKYPYNILIELSGMGGNPLAPYGDIKNNYANLINSNIDAFKYSLREKESKEKFYSVIVNKVKNLPYTDENVKKVYKCIDIIYNEFNQKNDSLNKIVIKSEVSSEYER